MSNRNTQNSMGEGLSKLLGDIAQMQAYPDADIQFLTELQAMVVGKIRSSMPSGQQGQMGMGPGNSQMGPASSPGGPAPMGGGMPGLSATGDLGAPGASSPNMDELSRMLGSASQAG